VTVEFWYEFASTYSYLSAMRIQAAARAAGVVVVWRPFLLGPIFAQQGWRDSPFNLYPTKGRYMWRDLERRAARHGLPFRRPSRFPRNGLTAARVALVAAAEDWCAEFTCAVFRANFVEDRDIGEAATVAEIVNGLGRDGAAVLAQAAGQDQKEALRAQTTAAAARGIFGAPSFVVGDELFWGDDRLEEALEWARRGDPPRQ
jgi:2-hydroxychromene-2-carboxylate isomerase